MNTKNFNLEKQENLIKVYSNSPKNFFAKYWEFSLWFFTLEDKTYIRTLTEFLIKKESTILETITPLNDGGTGLGLDTVTSRYHKFNLLNDDDILCKNLKKFIAENLNVYLSKVQSEILKDKDFEPVINCWFNVMENGKKIEKHVHNKTSSSFLSGHITLQCENSFTYYMCPYSQDVLEFINNKGECIFFPSYLEHGTSQHQGTFKRVTIAFDIYYNISDVNESIKHNVIKLFN